MPGFQRITGAVLTSPGKLIDLRLPVSSDIGKQPSLHNPHLNNRLTLPKWIPPSGPQSWTWTFLPWHFLHSPCWDPRQLACRPSYKPLKAVWHGRPLLLSAMQEGLHSASWGWTLTEPYYAVSLWYWTWPPKAPTVLLPVYVVNNTSRNCRDGSVAYRA